MRPIGWRATLLSCALVTQGCAPFVTTPAPSYADYWSRLPCVDRIGRCFDARIGDQPVVAIADAARHAAITSRARAGNPRLSDKVYWELPQPVTGASAMRVRVGPNALGMKEVGAPASAPQITLFPLEQQSLRSERKIAASRNVFVEGKPVITMQDQLAEKQLPPGRYVFVIRYRGQANWDLKSVLVEVQ